VIDLVICGIRGRMGQTLVRLAEAHPDLRIIGGIDQQSGGDVVTIDDAHVLLPRAQVVIDFSAASATDALIERCGDALHARAIVIGTTGLGDATQQRIDALATHAAVVQAANFSIGVNLLVSLARRAGAVLDAAQYDVEIVEAHHKRKADAPSGTALALAQAVASGRGVSLGEQRIDGRSGQTGARPDGQIGLHAVRGGGIVGDHSVMFIGERERVELRHEAFDRALFAEGALTAARWIARRAPGRYTMDDVLGLHND
jgi:4-hydroxy-tetrahydrodipicolinate reductase